MEIWEIKRVITKLKRIKRWSKGDPSKKRTYRKTKHGIRGFEQKLKDTDDKD